MSRTVRHTVTLAPGEATGWHLHDRELHGVLRTGELTHHAPWHLHGIHVYRAGDPMSEGAHYAHEARNEGDEVAILDFEYVVADDEPDEPPTLTVPHTE